MRNKIYLAIAASLLSSSLYAMDCNFKKMDVNDDGKITKEEFHKSIKDASTLSNLDLNKDGYLDNNEFRQADFDYGLFGTWDVDNDDRLDDEFYNGVYTNYDWNEDGLWDENEWADAGDDEWWDIF